MHIRPYILAGGRSSRMGRDKAMLSLGGKTLLGRAVETLKSQITLGDTEGKVTVTLVGARTDLEGADRVIADGYPGCGPLGGIEAALRDLKLSEGEYAFFLPVDMPFLPPQMITALLREWVEASHQGARVCYVQVDQTPQPLVSMVHKSLYPFIAEALTAGRFKVTPVLESAAESLASLGQDSLVSSHLVRHRTKVDLGSSVSPIAGWMATEEQEKLKRLWFSNLNNEEDLREAETFASLLGSS